MVQANESSQVKQGKQKRARRNYTPEQKMELVMKSLEKGNSSEVYKEADVNPNVFYRWRNIFIEGGKAALKGMKMPETAGGAKLSTEDRLKLLVADLYLQSKGLDVGEEAEEEETETETNNK